MRKLIPLVRLVSLGLALSAGLIYGQAAKPQAPDASVTAPPQDTRAEAYYHFSLGRVYERAFEEGGRSQDANLAIEHYKKAYELDPRTAVIAERLAEMYAKAQRIRDAVLEAQEILKRDPDNLPARRLLARIYLRTLGDLDPSVAQRDTVRRAAEQLREILRIEPTDTDAGLWLARLYRLQNDHPKAEEVLRQILEREPANEASLEQLSQLLSDAGRKEEAIELLQNAAEGRATAGILGLLGEAYAQAGDYARAEHTYRKALNPEFGAASAQEQIAIRRGLVEALLAQFRHEEAAAELEQLARLEPDDPEHYLRLGQLYRHLKKLDQAERSLAGARERSPGNLQVAYEEALLLEAQGNFEQAIRKLSSAVVAAKSRGSRAQDSRETLAILYEQLGRLYREVENYQAAILTFREMERLGRDAERRSRVLVADTLRESKDFTGAMEESSKALEQFPGDWQLRLAHAVLLGELRRTEEAAKMLHGMLDGGGLDRAIQVSLAQVYERGQRYAEAGEVLDTLEASAAQESENEIVWLLRAAVYERQKKYAQAETQFRKVLDLNPQNALALNNYGYMLAEAGTRLDEAEEMIKRALETDAHNGAYLDSLGWVYFKQNRLAEAEELLRRAASRQSRDPDIREHLGDLLDKTGRMAQAAAEWERALVEWQRAAPADHDPEKVADLEAKLARVRKRLASRPPSEVKPR